MNPGWATMHIFRQSCMELAHDISIDGKQRQLSPDTGPIVVVLYVTQLGSSLVKTSWQLLGVM